MTASPTASPHAASEDIYKKIKSGTTSLQESAPVPQECAPSSHEPATVPQECAPSSHESVTISQESAPVPQVDADFSQNLFVEGLLSEFAGGMNERYGRLVAANDLWDFALDLAFHNDPRVAFRSAWALEWAYFNDPRSFKPHTAHFFDNFMKAVNPSVHRHFAKMLYDMMRRRDIIALDDTQASAAAGKCFGLLIDPSTRVAVKAWCMDILFDLAPQLDWVEEHLRDAVQMLLDANPSAGLANRGFKLLRRLDKLRRED